MSAPAAILETILARLTVLFLIGAGGDPDAARAAAAQMLATYNPRTADEARLAAAIIGFSFQALEALSQAAIPDMPLARVLRLRGSAVSLNREAAKAERRLDQLRHAKPVQQTAPQPEADTQPEPALAPKIEHAVALIQETATVAAAAKAGNITWTQAYQQRQRDARIAASLLRAERRLAEQATQAANSQAHQSA